MSAEALCAPRPVLIDYDATAARELPDYAPGNVQLGGPLIVRDFFGRSGDTQAGPQGYIYEVMPAHSYVGAHFHSVHQFQVFFPAEDSWYQRHRMASPMLLYSDPYTTYGPFGTGDRAMSFFTLRPSPSDVTGYMPGARDKLLKGPGRNLSVELGPLLSDVPPGQVTVADAIAPFEDWLAAEVYAVGTGCAFRTPAPPPGCAGQYVCVLDGTVTYAAKTFHRHSLGWCAPASGGAVLSTGSTSGAHVLVCQFPRSTSSDVVDPS